MAAIAGALTGSSAHANEAGIAFDLAQLGQSRLAISAPASTASTPLPRSQRLDPPAEAKARVWSDEDRRARRTAQTLEYTFHALNLADGLLTARCLDRGRCREANPLLGRNPSPFRLVGVKLLMSGLHYAGYRQLIDRNPKQARLVNMISVGVMAGVTGVGIAVNY